MAKVHVTNINILDNPSAFDAPFRFEITFEAIEHLPDDLEWRIIYVGSAESEQHDQVLDTVFVGPVPEGRHMFLFDAPGPDVTRIPVCDALGVTVVLITCCYRLQEFVRVGYYVNNDYTDPELLECRPEVPRYECVQRNILHTCPRVTRFKITWKTGDEELAGQGGVSGTPNTDQSSLEGVAGAFSHSPHSEEQRQPTASTSCCDDVRNKLNMAVHNALPPPPVDENTSEFMCLDTQRHVNGEGDGGVAATDNDDIMDFSL